jgi:hypothetical protein
MKYVTVEDVIASFSRPVPTTVQGEPDYQTIHATMKYLQDNSRAIDAHLGGGTLGHLGFIISDASYATACRRWNEKHLNEKTWTQLKSHFAAAHRQHKQMQGGSAATAG